mmetsp:Transcript_28746/g.72761  ORF Transcript_28746/g.72761 Transcript_28746/m.72761 type:complete len:200 (+) Transcript_28746:466-1065(+)
MAAASEAVQDGNAGGEVEGAGGGVREVRQAVALAAVEAVHAAHAVDERLLCLAEPDEVEARDPVAALLGRGVRVWRRPPSHLVALRLAVVAVVAVPEVHLADVRVARQVLQLHGAILRAPEDLFLPIHRQLVEGGEVMHPALRDDEAAPRAGVASGDDGDFKVPRRRIWVARAIGEAGHVQRVTIDEGLRLPGHSHVPL